MSIFKETFQDFVFNQLKIREASINPDINRLSGIPRVEGKDLKNSSNITLPAGAFYTNTTSKQCIIRMSSGVDLKEDTNVVEGNPYENPKDLEAEGLAIRYILEGGIPAKDIDFLKYRTQDREQLSQTGKTLIQTIPRGRATRQFTRGNEKSYGSSYGDAFLRSDAKDGFGIVPMPGIIDAEIRTKTAYGSLREAKVNFVCHNRRQLDVLETLYMRPGMPILLEWGWNPYISNLGERETYFPYIFEWFDSKSNINEINREIHKRIELSGGNYDGFVGYIKNFEIIARQDGGYNCSTELAAMGEVLEGISGKSEGFTIPNEDGTESVEVDNLEYYLNSLINYCEVISQFEAVRETIPQISKELTGGLIEIQNKILPLIPGIEYNASFKFDNEKLAEAQDKDPTLFSISSMSTIRASYNNEIRNIEKYLDNYLLFKNENLDNSSSRGKNKQGIEVPMDSPTRSTEHYIKWELLVLILNNLVIESYQETGNKSSPITEFSILDELPANGKKDYLKYSKFSFKNDQQFKIKRTKKYGSTEHKINISDLLDISIDPSICLLPHQLDTITSQILGDGGGILDTLVEKTDNRKIGDIYISLDYLLKTYKRLRYKDEEINEDFNLFTFIQTIWEKDINNACVGTHEFLLSTEKSNPNIARIVDMIKDSDGLQPSDLFEFNIHSNNSIVRDFNYNTTIDSKLSSTIAVASQSPDSIDSLDAVSFAAFNRNIKHRFFKEKEVDEAKIEDIKNKKILKYNRDIEELQNMLGFLYDYKIDILKGNFKDNDKNNLQTSTARRYIKNIESKIISLKTRYSDTDKDNGIFKGFRKKNFRATKSSIIPLKFNAQIDGIGGIVIGNVFKVKKDRLPIGYQGDDIAFAVMTENQKITVGQDWVTEFSGQLILLDLPKEGDYDDILLTDSQLTIGEGSNIGKFSPKTSANRYDDNLTLEQSVQDPGLNSVNEGDPIFLKVPTRAAVRDQASIDNMFTDLLDWNNNIIGYVNGKGKRLGTVKVINNQPPYTKTIEVTSGQGNSILSDDEKARLGWNSKYLDQQLEVIDKSDKITVNWESNTNWEERVIEDGTKFAIPFGVKYKYELEVSPKWYLIKFDPIENREFGFEYDDNIVRGTGGFFDGDDFIVDSDDNTKSLGWMREDVLQSSANAIDEIIN